MNNSKIVAIWRSFNALPLWVRVWVAGILMPINLASILFVDENLGLIVSFLAIIAMLPNLFIMVYERGLSKLMAVPHLIPWTILVVLIVYQSPDIDTTFGAYLWCLAFINTVSLLFDYPDSIKWLRGDRAIAS